MPLNRQIFDKINKHNSGSYLHTQIVPKRATGYDYGLGNFYSDDFRDQTNTTGNADIPFCWGLSKKTPAN